MWLRDVAALPVRLLGLGILKPTETADRDYKTSAVTSEAITEAILRGEGIDADEHVKKGQKARAAHKEAVEKEWERLGSQSGQAASGDQCEDRSQAVKRKEAVRIADGHPPEGIRNESQPRRIPGYDDDPISGEGRGGKEQM
uniref:Uncharacterized protein n=1 Tax=Chromera velia CCMP2878 TaxID=1169474 RepID=A0A0G4F7W4_9ALVE|eukprot:Cvel_15477.t1-p1 / transcript=Cvel_15477.t1 / gene=Cvel_15477 / organism=Chromera_velia_CCMP2878 / gene_product=hypothetical protein / transcript_product=hypothetical protein / location=Cvel_scaffold1147:53142-53564(+) / protein_length=141 / sequence_SO=supercontig / SO=protein_coding / is_pseudo=false